MFKSNLFRYTLIAVVALASCKPKENKEEAQKGDVDATRFITIGGAITAGYMDDALYAEGQENGLGALLSLKLSDIGGVQVNSAMMPSGSIGANAYGNAPFKLGMKTDCLGATGLSPIRIAASGDISALMQYNFNPSSPYTNFGIPGISMAALNYPGFGNPANGPGNYNPYFARLAANQTSSTVKADIMATNPTFFSMQLGLDEVLAFALTGAKTGSLIPASGFDATLNDLVASLTSNGAKGVITTIPDVTEFPYFTTIPYDGLVLDEANAASLNSIYNPIGISFHAGKNGFVIQDPTAGAFGVRQMVAGEKILLSVPLDSVRCNKMGSVFPFRNEFVLTIDEQIEIRSKITAYNSVIQNTASTYNLALVDGYNFFKGFETGITYNGIAMTAKFVSGGAFSLDGTTLSPRGNALYANQFIKAINTKYNSKIWELDATKYRGVKFP